MTKQLCALFLLLLAGLFVTSETSAQANLSFQGILKKANGLAVDDGTYDLTFTLYTAETGGTQVFQETISDVDVAGGIYSVILGAGSTSLSAAFDVPYFLGIRVGGPSATEMVPRIRLTSAPYALALRGSSNSFPGSGAVIADSIRAKGKIVARAGQPGVNSSSNNGYGFSAPGDRDGGMYSEADGQVAIWANNSERILVSNTAGDNRTYLKSNVTVNNSLTVTDQLSVGGNVTSDLKFANQRGLQYNGLNDWRLVDRDDFTSGSDGWEGTSSLISTSPATIETVSYGDFNGNVIRPTGGSNTPVLKKQFNLSGVGAYTYVKVVFKYYFTDSWDYNHEIAYAGFSTDDNATNPVICWQAMTEVYTNNATISYTGANWSDAATIGSMVAYNPGTSFYVFVGMRSDDDTGNERYALGNVEVWVR